MRRRNPYVNRKPLSARAARRALALSPRQQARAIGRLRAEAARLIDEGLERRLAEQAPVE